MKQFELAAPIGKPLTEAAIREEAARKLGIRPDALGETRIVRRSIDARKDILYRYRIEAARKGEALETFVPDPYLDVSNSRSVIVVGAGPAGMFAALKLLQRGLRPIVLERGKDVHARKKDMAALSLHGVVDPDSNYCFGEGGAGAFSDGKLYTRSTKRGDIREVLSQLVIHGADPDILVDAHPHLGTDRLPGIVENIRNTVTSHGGEYHFGCRVTSIERLPDGILRVTAADGQTFEARDVILATGHSARDIYEMLHGRGISLEAKGFALGVRVEHPQWLINQIRYHGKYQPFMPTADYSFVRQVDGRGVFSFCMCPGGILVPSSTEPDALVLNGMSNSARNSRWANSGVVVQIEPGDEPEEFRASGVFSLLDFQRDVERRMFRYVAEHIREGANPLAAPAQRLKDFCRGIESRDLPKSSYTPGVLSAPLHELLPEHVYIRLKRALPEIDREMKGWYTNDALVLGVESRTSSPVRIPRDPVTLQHPAMPGLYPAGEGAGYAGGIVSSALDGIACASAVSI